MKRLLTLFICLGASMPMLSHAQLGMGDEKSDSWELRESPLEVYELKNPEPLAEAESLVDEEIVTKKGVKFTLHGNFIDPESRSRLNELTPEQQKNFHQIRLTIIQRMAAILNSQSLSIGAAIATKDKIVGLYQKIRKTEGDIAVKAEKLTLRQTGVVSVERILNNINHKFWSEAANVGDAKEVTLYITPVGQAVLAIPKVKLGGVMGMSLGIGYIKATDVLFVEVLGYVEKVKSGFIGSVAAKVLVGLSFDSNEKIAPAFKAQVGEVYHPAVVPLWEGGAKGIYTAGVAAGISLPPGDAFFYRSESKKFRFIRLGISTVPMWTMVYRAFQRMHAPEKLLIRFEEKARLGVFANSCSRLF